MEEIWKDVIGYEGLYKISNLGRVKSLERITIHRGCNRKIKEKILNGNEGIGGYLRVHISNNGKTKSKNIHKLVCDAFLGFCNNDFEVNHKDGNKLNNKLNNLEIISQRDNVIHRSLMNKKTSKYTGVNWKQSHSKWVSQIQINGKKIHLGLFDNEIDAYNRYLIEYNKIV